MPLTVHPRPSKGKERVLLRARAVLPVSQPAISDGAVLISGKRIAAVGRWRDMRADWRNPTLDLGDVALMPGLVNAHCHLDYTNMAGQFPPPKVFSDWLKVITSTKSGWSYSDYAESWLNGARMLASSGTTTVADIEALPELLPEVWESTPLRVLSLLEMTGIRSRRQPRAILQEAVERIESLGHPRGEIGLSPHAPYSTLPELLRLSAQTARRRKWRLAIHVAESALEFEMFARGAGEMFDWLKRSERDMSDCGLGSPVQHLERCGALGENLLAIHVNYLAPNDAALLSKRKVNVVHCPRSHAYFRHEPFPMRQLSKAGVNICIGTDSLASVYKVRKERVGLNMFDEMREMAAAQSWLRPRKLVEMATINGARALGMQGQIGQLSPRLFADIVAIPFAGKIGDIYEAVLHHKGNVAASMIDGEWAIAPRQ
ncbi:MAG: aminodeoxyfutalosine deaminase [Verrucomicrobiota bacterium]